MGDTNLWGISRVGWLILGGVAVAAVLEACVLLGNSGVFTPGELATNPTHNYTPTDRNRGPVFRGKVVDAVTHKPVEEFIAVPGYASTIDSTISYVNSHAEGSSPPRTFQGGEYKVDGMLNWPPEFPWYVRVEARGYLAQISPPQHGSATVDFELTPAKDIVGHVFGPDGLPAADVSVVAVPAGDQLVVGSDTLDGRAGNVALSDKDGAFDLNPQEGAFDVVAVSPRGSAVATQKQLAASADLHLSEWGTVQGRMMLGSKPAADCRMEISSPNSGSPFSESEAYVQFSQELETDGDGYYSAQFTRPGPVTVARYVGSTRQTIAINMEPGKTMTVNIGGGGRLVRGKAILAPVASGGPKLSRLRGIATGFCALPATPQMPAAVKNGTADARIAWIGAFALTPAGNEFFQAHPPLKYSLEFGKEGTFQIEDVQAGDYQIEFMLPAPNGVEPPTMSASFTMPPITADVADQPLAIPDITVQ